MEEQERPESQKEVLDLLRDAEAACANLVGSDYDKCVDKYLENRRKEEKK